jgi:alpha-2-macroglobulin-like protein
MADNTDHASEAVDAYLHDLLTPEEARRVERHCAECPDCAKALADARRRLRALQALPPVEASERLIERTERRLRVPDQPGWLKRFRGARAVVAAAVVIVAATAALHAHYLMMAPTPYDLSVFGQNRLLADTDASLRIIVANTTTGAGLAGVPVEIRLAAKNSGETVTLAHFETNALGTGSPSFHLPDWKDGECELHVSARPGNDLEEIHRVITLKRSWQVQVATDRPVYQPGQTLLFRSLALRQPDLRPANGENAVFTISDPKGNKIFHETKVTSRFGIASAKLPLADEITEGTYRIECQVGDNKGSNAVAVKRYALPKFKVAVTSDRLYYKPGDNVKVRVRADYFFGKPVTAGSAAIEVRASDDPGQARQFKAPINNEGLAEFLFPAPAIRTNPAQAQDAELQLNVQVTDSAGQQQVTGLSCPLTNESLRIDVIPEAGNLVAGIENTIYLMTRYPDGSPAKTELEVSGIPGKVSTDELGLASVRMTPTTIEEIVLKVTAKDADGHNGQRETKLLCSKDEPRFLLRMDKAVYNGGETMHVSAAGGNAPIYLDLLKDGQTRWTGSIAMTSGKGECFIELPADLFGALELSAYCRDKIGSSQPSSRVVYVRHSRGLDVVAETDRKEYRPGQRARVSFRLKDRAGQAIPGALSLAAVDEAIFSIPGQAADQPFLSSEENDLLQPVRSLYPWSPDASTNAPAEKQDRLEKALFARAANQSTRDSHTAMLRQLLPFLEDDERALAVLDRSDWEQWINPDTLSPEVVTLLRGNVLHQSLIASTYPGKIRQVEADRQAGLTIVTLLWMLIGFLVGIILLVALIYFLIEREILGAVLLPIILVWFTIWLLMPNVQAVRVASPRTRAMNDLRQIELAMNSYRLANGKSPLELLTRPDNSPSAPRVRQWFPETLLWRPEIITDDDGRASIDLPLADSITDWRLSASAVTADGRLGQTQTKIRVFQPFFVDVNPPVSLTRGDEVAFPVVVYNYLNKPQKVTLKLEDANWFDRLDDQTKQLELKPNEVLSVSFRLKCRGIGHQEMLVTATGDGGADAVRRTVEVVPEGQRTERVVNGNLQRPAEMDLVVPEDAVEGSVKALVRFYPSSFSQLVEGLDGIFQLPYGCFEQTSSTTYPNILALDYLRRIKRADPKLEQKAREYIQLGYQRLLTFEVAGGGFDWFGNPPANRVLTAYGLAEFSDMARVREVDPALIERTRKWLLKVRRPDGSWDSENHLMHDGPARGADEPINLSTTAYIAAAVFANGQAEAEAYQTRAYLLQQAPASIRNPYTLALVCNALLALDPRGNSAAPYLTRLREMRHSDPASKLVWWSPESTQRTIFYGAGRAGDVETTALACLALIHSGQDPEAIRGALAWIASQRDGNGTWYSTQATVLALKALLEGTGKPLGGDGERRIEIAMDGKRIQELVIPADQSEVLKVVDLSSRVSKKQHHLTITRLSEAGADYQVALIYHAPINKPGEPETLTLRLNYDRSELRTGESITANASVVNTQATASPMVMVEVPIPPGFTLETEDLDRLLQAGQLAKFQQTQRKAILYVRSIDRGRTLELRYHLRATMPGIVTAPSAIAYEYYNPDRLTRTAATKLSVAAAN